MFYRDIVCFANSIKFNARCIAGKDINSLEWIRPISEASDGELSKEQIKCDNNGEPDLLDIIRIPFKTEKAKYYQPENIVIENIKWQKIGRFQEEKLDDICDRPDTILDNSHPGNKKISLTHLKKCGAESSLLLIKVDSVKVERKNYNEDKKYRAVFFYNGMEYNLPITDPKIRSEYENKSPGIYSLNAPKIYLCISLSEPYQPPDSSEEAYCYKLVAAIIRINK